MFLKNFILKIIIFDTDMIMKNSFPDYHCFAKEKQRKEK